MSNDTTQHTPADVRERVTGAWATVEAAALARADLLDSNFAGQRAQAAEIRNAVAHVAALLRTPRGEGEVEAQPWRKVGEDPPPNGVQVLAYDPRPDGYSYAGCWAYTLIRKGDEYYLDGERCDEEDRSRLRIEEWLWQPLPPYPGPRSKDDGVRDAALRSDAQGEDTIPVSALRSEIALLRKHRLLPYLAWARLCALAGGEPVGEDSPAARRGEGGGEEQWEDLIFAPIVEAYNEAHAALRSGAQEGEEDALVCASCGEPIGDEPTVIWQDAYTHYRCTPEDAIRDDTPVIRPIDTARRGEGGGE